MLGRFWFLFALITFYDLFYILEASELVATLYIRHAKQKVLSSNARRVMEI